MFFRNNHFGYFGSKPSLISCYLKDIKICDFCNSDHFREIFYPGKVSKPQNCELNTCPVWDSLFSNIWSKYDIDTRISQISSYSNEIRVSVTYLITITLISNRKVDIQRDFRFLFLMKSRNKISVKCIFFPIGKSSNREI